MWNLKSLNLILWKYTVDTPVETLLQHHRVARWVVRVWIFSTVGMFSSLALGLLFGFSNIDLVVLLVLCGLALGLMIPVLFAVCIMGEIEKTLREIGWPLPKRLAMTGKIQTGVLAIWFWLALAIFGPGILKYFTS